MQIYLDKHRVGSVTKNDVYFNKEIVYVSDYGETIGINLISKKNKIDNVAQELKQSVDVEMSKSTQNTLQNSINLASTDYKGRFIGDCIKDASIDTMDFLC